MRTRCKILLILFLTAFIGVGSLYPLFAQKNPKRLYILDERKKKVSVKFKLINNLIVLPVRVNNSDTLNFILDTGISNTILQSVNTPGLQPLTYTKDLMINGLGEGSSQLAHHAIENKIDICGVVGEHQDLLIVDDNDLKLSNLLGIPIHGIIGYELFKDLIVEINYQQQLVTFHTHKKYQYKANCRRQAAIPMMIDDSKPYINAIITQADSTEIPVRLLLDLGASYALWVKTPSTPLLKMPEKTAQVYLGFGLSGIVMGKIGRFPKITLGRFEFSNVLASFPDTTSVGNVRFQENRNGSLGAEMLSRFNLIIDYRGQKLTLTPNKNFKRPFRCNLSGMEIAALIPGQQIYTISYILPSSPAEKAGLAVGDLILEINGQPTNELSISEITGLFIQRPGKKMRIRYNRDGVEKYTALVLEEGL